MKVPLSWINEYTDISDITYKQYEQALTMSGSKVEGYEDIFYVKEKKDPSFLSKIGRYINKKYKKFFFSPTIRFLFFL